MLKLHSVLIFHGLAGLDAKQDLMRLRVLAFQIVTVICGHKRNGKFVAHFDQPRIGDFLFRNAIFHDLQKKIVFAEDRLILHRRLSGRILVPPHNKAAISPWRQALRP